MRMIVRHCVVLYLMVVEEADVAHLVVDVKAVLRSRLFQNRTRSPPASGDDSFIG